MLYYCLRIIFTFFVFVFNRYEEDFWFWDLDWSVNIYKLNKFKKKFKDINKVYYVTKEL